MKKLLSLFLCLVLLVGLLPLAAPARAATVLAVSSVKADKTSSGVGATITWTASASGGTGTLRYYFNLYKDGTKLTARSYSTANTFSYTPEEAGSYKVRVYVKDADGTKVSKLSAAITVAPLTLSSVKADKATADTEEKITWTAAASGGTGTLQYYFILYKDGTKIKTRSYSTKNTFSYTPAEPGTYKVRVYVKDADGTKVNKLSGGVTVSAPISATSYCLFDAVKSEQEYNGWNYNYVYYAQVILGDGSVKLLPISDTTYTDLRERGRRGYVYTLTTSQGQYILTAASTDMWSYDTYNTGDFYTDYSGASFVKYSGTEGNLKAGLTAERPQAKSTVIIFYTSERSGTINVRKVKTVWFTTSASETPASDTSKYVFIHNGNPTYVNYADNTYTYTGYLEGEYRNDLLTKTALSGAGFYTTTGKNSAGYYTLKAVEPGTGKKTGYRVIKLSNNPDQNNYETGITYDYLVMKDADKNTVSLSLAGVKIINMTNSDSIGLPIDTVSDLITALNYYDATIALVEVVGKSAHTIGGSAIYVTSLTER